MLALMCTRIKSNLGSWALLVKRVPHGLLPLRSGDDVRLSHLAMGSPTPQLATCRRDARPCTPVTAVMRHVTMQRLVVPVPPLVPAGVARAFAHVVGPAGSGG
jgi:hypothetical protein